MTAATDPNQSKEAIHINNSHLTCSYRCAGVDVGDCVGISWVQSWILKMNTSSDRLTLFFEEAIVLQEIWKHMSNEIIFPRSSYVSEKMCVELLLPTTRTSLSRANLPFQP